MEELKVFDLSNDELVAQNLKYGILTIPPGYVEIANELKEATKQQIKKLVIAEDVKTLVENHEKQIHTSFKNCMNLVEVFIHGENLKNISPRCFEKCVNLKQITLPASVEIISASAFAGCIKLEEIIGFNSPWNEENTIISKLRYIGDGAFAGCRYLRNFFIPPEVKEIRPNCFYGCESLRFMIIPDAIERIGDFAFSCCELLRFVSFEARSQLTLIGKGVFKSCNSLEKITRIDSLLIDGYRQLKTSINQSKLSNPVEYVN